MLYRDIIAVFSQIHTKHVNTLCGQNVELLNLIPLVYIVTTGLWFVNFPQDSALHLLRCHHSANRTCNAVTCAGFISTSSMFPFMLSFTIQTIHLFHFPSVSNNHKSRPNSEKNCQLVVVYWTAWRYEMEWGLDQKCVQNLIVESVYLLLSSQNIAFTHT